MYNNTFQGGAPQGGARPQKRPKINEVNLEGIVTSRSTNAGEPIKFFNFQNGGGAIHITVITREPSGTDQYGNQKVETSYIPVNVMTNKNITEAQLRSVVPGMKVRVVGKLSPESYTSKKNGQKITALVVNAFVFEILEMPQQAQGPQGFYGAPQPGYGQPGPAPQYGGPFPQQPYGPQVAPQQQYPPQGRYPQGPAPAPAYGPQVPQQQYPSQGGYPQQGAYGAPAAPGAPVQAPPPYYQAPQPTAQPPQPTAQPPRQAPEDLEDLPAGDAMPQRDLNI